MENAKLSRLDFINCHPELDSGSCCYSLRRHPEFISGSRRYEQEVEMLKCEAHPRRVQHDKFGFTLIELLVVVLIIGILASVALPQYNKAVRKARLAEVASTFNSISKGIDMWLLENGFPASSVHFSGNGSDIVKLDITQSCVTEIMGNCFTKVGNWWYYCESDHCEIDLNTNDNADGTIGGNKWLNGVQLFWIKYPNTDWALVVDYMSSDVKPEICRWWKDLYGDKRVMDAYGDISTECDAY